MNRRQKIIISVSGIFIVLLALIGLTYAYFLTRITGNTNPNSISVTTTNLQLVYADGNGILQTGKLEPSNDYITFLDGQGNEHSSKIFTVTESVLTYALTIRSDSKTEIIEPCAIASKGILAPD